MIESVNNKLILEPYRGVKKLKSKISSGFATVEQRTALVGLKVLAKGVISTINWTTAVNEGDVVYFSEEVLYTQSWSTNSLTSAAINVPFIVAEGAYAIMIEKSDK